MDQATLGILREFREAIVRGKGGEVVLRSGEHTGRVFFAEGRIAWVVASTVQKTFFSHLTENTDLGRDDLREVFASCKESGANFGETIVEWGLLDEAALRAHLLAHVSDCLLEILSWPDLNSMFVPEDRPYKGSLTFDLEEVLEATLRRDPEGRLPFDGASAADLVEAAETQPGPEAEPPSPAPLVSDLLAGEQPSAAPARPKRWVWLAAGVGVLLVAGGAAAWFLWPGAPPAAPRSNAPDARPPDLSRPDLPARPDAGPPDAHGSADSAPASLVVGAPSKGFGSVHVASRPSRAQILLDGVHLGRRTPFKLARVAADVEHVIQVERPRHLPTAKRFKLAPGMQARLQLKLRRDRRRRRPGPPPMPVRLVTVPAGALVLLDGRRQAEVTPTTVELSQRRLTRVELRKRGFRRWRRRIKPPANPRLTYQVKLRKVKRRRRRRPRRRRKKR